MTCSFRQLNFCKALDNIEHVEVRSDNANHRGRSSPKQYRAVALSDDARLTTSDVWRLSVAYIGPKSRRERGLATRETQINTEVALVTGVSATTFKVQNSKVRSHRRRRIYIHIVAASRTAC